MHRFIVHQSAYMVHRPHSAGPAKRHYKERQRNIQDQLRKGETPEEPPLNTLFFREQIEAGMNCSILVTAGWEQCRRALPHWQQEASWSDRLTTDSL